MADLDKLREPIEWTNGFPKVPSSIRVTHAEYDELLSRIDRPLPGLFMALYPTIAIIIDDDRPPIAEQLAP